jgi:hypothetical protein
MSDYLHALVERAQGEARRVRPLLAPRFAPAPQAEELEVDVEVPAAPRQARPEAAVVRAPEPTGTPSPHPDSPRPAPGRTPSETRAPAEVRRGVTTATTEPAADAADDDTRHVSPAVEVEETMRVVERHVVDETTPQASEPSVPVEVTVERMLTLQPPELPPAPEPAAPPAAVQALPTDVVDDLASIAAVEAETQTVVVSIGRIEVNAERPSPPPPPAAARSWAGPRLSLDDYLRERSGGRR